MTKITQQARDIAANAAYDRGSGALARCIKQGERDEYSAVIAAQRALDAPRAPMTDDEILQRARRARASIMPFGSAGREEVMRGAYDAMETIRVIIAALRDLDKPVGPDPDVIVCREFMAAEATDAAAERIRAGGSDDTAHMRAVLAAYRSGKAGGHIGMGPFDPKGGTPLPSQHYHGGGTFTTPVQQG